MSQGISFLYEFDIGNRNIYNPGLNIISVTSQASGDFDKSNLNTESVRQTWRSSDILTWQEVVIEADVESAIDTFGILGHNFSEDAVVQLQANVSNNFVAPPITLTLPWSRQNIVNTLPLGDIYKYYKVRVLDPTNINGFVEIGRIVGGRAVTMINSEDISDEFELGYEDMAKIMKTEGYFRASNENVKVRTLSAKFSKLVTVPGQNQNFIALRNMFRYVGITRPFLTILNREDPGFCSIWGQLLDLPNESYTVNQYVSQSIKIMEVF